MGIFSLYLDYQMLWATCLVASSPFILHGWLGETWNLPWSHGINPELGSRCSQAFGDGVLEVRLYSDEAIEGNSERNFCLFVKWCALGEVVTFIIVLISRGMYYYEYKLWPARVTTIIAESQPKVSICWISLDRVYKPKTATSKQVDLFWIL